MDNSLHIPLDRMPNVDKKLLFSEVAKLGRAKVAYFYIINSDFRKSVNVQGWLQDWLDSHDINLPLFMGSDDSRCLQSLAWVKSKVQYEGDMDKWHMAEHWSLPDETLQTGVGDCEDGAILLYAVLRHNGINDDQVWITCGSVLGGGHCYVVYNSSADAVTYTLDWCYNSFDSMRVPYTLNKNYNNGGTEWFRFNYSGSYIKS